MMIVLILRYMSIATFVDINALSSRKVFVFLQLLMIFCYFWNTFCQGAICVHLGRDYTECEKSSFDDILLYLLCQEKYAEKYKLVGGVSFLKKRGGVISGGIVTGKQIGRAHV